jgi:hypothetical protein
LKVKEKSLALMSVSRGKKYSKVCTVFRQKGFYGF